MSKDLTGQQHRTRRWAVICKPRAVNHYNEMLALYHAGTWDDKTLNQALGEEIQRGAMLTSWESVPIELTGRQSGRCVEFKMPKHGDKGDVWWAEEADILSQ